MSGNLLSATQGNQQDRELEAQWQAQYEGARGLDSEIIHAA